MAEQKTYLYGVIRGDEPRHFPFTGIGGQVYTIPYRDLAAVVSDTPALTFATLSREEVLRHLVMYQYVTEQVLREHSILPAKFGTQIPEEAALQPILEAAYPKLTAALSAIEGKIEFDVVAVWNDFNAILREIGDSPEFRALRAGFRQKAGPDSEGDRLKAGAAVKQALDRRRENLAREIVATLGAVAGDLRQHDILEGDGMIANLAFLIEKTEAATFDSRLGELDQHYQQKITFRRVGPLPPHSFRTLEIRGVDFEALERARELLGLLEQVTLSEIEQAYCRLARQYHPDQTRGDAKKFQALREAYKVLIDYCQGVPADSTRYSFRQEEAAGFQIRIAAPPLSRSRVPSPEVRP